MAGLIVNTSLYINNQMSKSDHTRYRSMLKYLNINNTHISKITGLEYKSVGNATVSNRFSGWLKVSLYVFDRLMEEIKGLKGEIEELTKNDEK